MSKIKSVYSEENKLKYTDLEFCKPKRDKNKYTAINIFTNEDKEFNDDNTYLFDDDTNQDILEKIAHHCVEGDSYKNEIFAFYTTNKKVIVRDV